MIGEVNGTSGDFDPGTGVVNFTSVNYTDVYIAKYTSSGQFVWLQKFGGTGNEYARKIKMGKNGEVAMSSNFDATIDLDPGPGTNNVTSAGSNDVLIARFYSNGNLSWVKTIGNASANLAPGIGIDEKGNIYSAGSFSGTLDTDPNATTTNFLTATGTASDGVIIKLDSTGVFQWSKKLSSNSAAVLNDVQPDGNDNIYLTGWFSGFVDLDPGIGLDTMTNISGIDVFLLKMNDAGNHVWAKRTGNSGPDFYDGRSVKMDTEGNPYVLGIFEGTADFDPGTAVNNQTALGDFDIFVWGLDTSGNFRFSKGIGGTGKDVAVDLHINANGIYFAGFFSGSVDFNPWTGTNLINPASSSPDFHFNKWNYCSPTAFTLVHNSCNSTFTLNGQTYTTAGNYTQTFTNSGGCDSTLTLQLSFTNIDTAITFSGNTLTATQSGASYQWFTCNGNWSPIANATQQSFTASQSGQYSVAIMKNSCVDTSFCINFTVVDIPSLSEKVWGKIYPNPTNGTVFFEWHSVEFPASLFVYDYIGQLVYHTKTNGEQQTIINLNQPPGNYFVKIVSKDMVDVVPLVKL